MFASAEMGHFPAQPSPSASCMGYEACFDEHSVQDQSLFSPSGISGGAILLVLQSMERDQVD